MFLNDDQWRIDSSPEDTLQALKDRVTRDADRVLLATHLETFKRLASGARRRSLSFYPGYDLIEVELSLEGLGLDADYQKAGLYALLSPNAARILTGESIVIHELNALKSGPQGRAALDLASEEQVLSYLAFFCMFVGSDLGPFVVVDRTDDVDWGATADETSVTTSFDDLARRRLQTLGWSDATAVLTQGDLDAFAASDGDAKALFGGRETDGPALIPAAAARGALGEPVSPATIAGRVPGKDGVESWKASATVWYGNHLYRTTFVIAPTGFIEMTEDDVLGFMSRPRWEFVSTLPLLARRRARRLREAQAFRMDLLNEAIGDRDVGPRTFRNLRITGDVDLRDTSFSRGLELDDVEIDGDLVLERATFAATLRLVNVAISGQLRAERVTADAIDAPSLRVTGAHDPPGGTAPKDMPVGIVFRGARLQGSLNIERADVGGGIDLREMQCGGTVTLSGVECDWWQPASYPFVTERLIPGCRLSGSSIAGDLDLSVSQRFGSSPAAGARPAEVAGGVDASRCVIGGSLNIAGLQTMRRDMQLVVTPSAVAQLAAAVSANLPAGSWRYLYSRRKERVVLVAPVIVDGDLSLQHTQIAGGLTADPARTSADSGARFRTSIAGSIYADQLRVRGDAILNGIEVGTVIDPAAEHPGMLGGDLSLHRARLGALACGAESGVPAKDRTPWRCEIRGTVVLRDASVDADALFTGARIHGPILAERVDIGQALGLDYSKGANERTHVKHLSLVDATVGKKLFGIGVRIDDGFMAAGSRIGAIHFDVVMAEPDAGQKAATGAWLRPTIGRVGLKGATILTSATFRGIDVRHEFKAQELRCEGGLEINGTTRLSTLIPASIGSVDDVNSAGEILTLERAVIRGHLSLTGTELRGDVTLSRLRAASVGLGFSPTSGRTIVHGSVAGYGIEVDDVRLSGVLIKGNLFLGLARVKDFVDGDSHPLQRTEIEGNITMSGAHVGADMRFCGARIGGDLDIITGVFDRVQIRGILVHREPPSEGAHGPRFEFQRPELRGILVQSAQLKVLDLYGARVSGRVSLVTTHVLGDVTLFKESPEQYLLHKNTDADFKACVPVPADISTSLKGDLRLKDVTIDGDLELTNLTCDGNAELSQVTIGGNLLATAEPVDRLAVSGERFSARFKGFTFNGSSVARDALLDGLRITGPLSAAGVEVKGEVRFSNDGEHGASMEIANAGAVVLSELKTHTLKFRGTDDVNRGLRLDRSRIEFLEVHRPLPASLNLSHAEVQTWVFKDPAGGKPIDIGDDLRELLTRTAPFDRSLYTAAERWLSKQGDDATAQKVHVDMRWREGDAPERRDQPGQRRPSLRRQLWMALSPWRGFRTTGRSQLIGVYTAFWTKGGRILIAASLLTLPLSTLVAGARENIAPTDASHSRAEMPDAQTWTPVLAAQVLVENHVPIIPVVTTQRWELAENRALVLRVPFVHERLPARLRGSDLTPAPGPAASTSQTRHGWVVPLVSPAAYGLCLRLVHWVAWPFFLIGFAANLQRRQQLS